jgi:hypothetical protein
MQYRLALEALRLAEAERMKQRKRTAEASREEVWSVLKAGLEDLLSDDSAAAVQSQADAYVGSRSREHALSTQG